MEHGIADVGLQADEPEHLGIEIAPGGAGCHHPVAVLALVGGYQGVGVDLLGEFQPVPGLTADETDAVVPQGGGVKGGLDVLAPAGASPLDEGRQDTVQHDGAAGAVAKAGLGLEGLVVGQGPLHQGAALGPDGGDVKAGEVLFRPLLTEGAEVDIDEARALLPESLIAQPQLLQGLGAGVGNEYVGAPDECLHGGLALGGFQIQGHTLFVDVLHLEDGVVVWPGRHLVAGPHIAPGLPLGGLHLDDLRAPVRHDPGRLGHGHMGAQLHDPDSLQMIAHRNTLLLEIESVRTFRSGRVTPAIMQGSCQLEICADRRFSFCFRRCPPPVFPK